MEKMTQVSIHQRNSLTKKKKKKENKCAHGCLQTPLHTFTCDAAPPVAILLRARQRSNKALAIQGPDTESLIPSRAVMQTV